MRKKILTGLLSISACWCFAQDSTIEKTSAYSYQLEAQAIAITNKEVPFWFRTNQFGSIPLHGASGSFLGKISREYKAKEARTFDWGFGGEARINAGTKAELILIEAYLKARFSIFQLKAGRSKDIIGLVDSSLSAGAFSVSGNALGIPKIELSVPEYWELPFTKQLIALKGNFAYGWFGTTPLRYNLYSPETKSFLHQKSLYGRLGKPNWKFKLFGGFNHQVMWGNEKKLLGPNYELSSAQTLWYVVIGKAYGNIGIPKSKIGNHIGSLDQGFEYSFANTDLSVYHQFFYEVGGLYHGNNLRDGLWGVVLKNKKESTSRVGWKKILIEYMGSKSQGGELDAPITPSGDEDYYNNYIYAHGWSYKDENIGNNFMTNRKYGRTNLPAREGEYVINNRVILLNAGIEGFVGKWNYTGKFSFSNNYGTYGSSPIGGSLGEERFPGPPPYFEKETQFSGYLQAHKQLKNNYTIGIALAADYGTMLYNSTGVMLSVSKRW